MLKMFAPIEQDQHVLQDIDQGRLVSVSRQIDPINAYTFLAQAHGSQRIYWDNRQHALSFAGYGIAAELVGTGHDRFNIIEDELNRLFLDAAIDTPTDNVTPRVFGGFAYQPDFASDGIWRAFPSAYFVLPRVLLTQFNGEAWLTLNACLPYGDEARANDELDTVLTNLTYAKRQTKKRRMTPDIAYPLSQDTWRDEIVTATNRMKADELDKVVLSRTADLTFNDDVDVLNTLTHLEDRYPDCYRFLIEPLPSHAFFGATPELLASVNGRQIKTAALAGSIKRGLTQSEDDALAERLMANPKERHEHALVADELRRLLQPITSSLTTSDQPRLLKLSNIQHLYTPFRGELNADYSILSVVGALHPTPALGGFPQKAALETIRNVETIPRGWYAAPVGWMDGDGNGQFAVAIRSAVVHGNTARLYAGAGIVADSDPDREWDETKLKFRPMMDALGAEIV